MEKIKLVKKSMGSLLLVFFLLGTSAITYAQQKKEIKGTVVDAESGIPLPDVSLSEKGTTNGTATDFDGNFTLNVSPDAVLVVTYMGFKTQEVSVNGKDVLQISMTPDLEALDEIVVVGYGSIKKTDLTGSVGTVGAEELTERNLTNPLEALQGNVPGVQINNSTGRIGDGFNITIRGKNSFSGNTAPLFIVDGVPTNDIDFLNPQDIERMDILKDASSTAIYGSRGTNGVVIITTKSGASAKPGLRVSFENFVGVKEVARLPQLMAPQTWWDYHQSAYLATAANDPATGAVSEQTLYNAVVGTQNSELLRRVNENESFDWYDAVLKTGIQQNNYLNVSGSSDNGVGYNLGLGYQQETGNVNNESLDKYTFKAGINHDINDKFSLGANLTLTKTNQQLGSDLAMREAFRLNPFLSPYGLDGELFPLPGKLTDENGDFIINKTSTYNPILEINNTTDEIRRWNAIGSAFFQYNPLEWLSFKTTFSTGLDQSRRGRAWGVLTNRGVSNNNLASANINNRENFNYTWDNQVNVNYTFDEEHTFNFLGLYSLFSDRTETSFLNSRNMPFETGFYNVGSGEQSTFNLGSNFLKQTLVSYALRLNYSFRDKYIVTLSNRWDGSSLLSEDNTWDTFPSAAVAWRISEEDFLQEQNTVSNLKLRVSYGFTGNNIISPYSTLNGLDRQTYYGFGDSTNNGWIPSSLANNQLGWEKTREANFGVDFGFFNNRITGSLDVYDRLSDDLLLDQRLPLETGWQDIAANVGSVSNKGVEATLTTRNIQTEDFTWTTMFTFTKNTNRVESIYGQSEVDDIGNNLFIGESIDAHFNYQFDGIWQDDEAAEAATFGMEPGQARVVDANGDGSFTPDDRMILGSTDPGWSGSFFTSVRYKNFDFSASVITNQDVFVFSPFHSNFEDVRDRGRHKLDINWFVPSNDAGLPARPSNTHPQPRNEGQFWRNDGIGYYKDASFIKVKNIAVGYNFNADALDKYKISKLRVYANVVNPFVFTEYDGYDPEWATAGLGVGRVSSVIYQVGLNLNF